MTDVTVHRCTLRIVRHGGWSWGPEPRKLLQSAIRALPQLLEYELSKLWQDNVECEISAPLKVRISLGMRELLEVAEENLSPPSANVTSTIEGIRTRIANAMGMAIAHEQVSTTSEQHTRASEPEEPEEPDSEIIDETLPVDVVLRVLLSWQKNEVLLLRLADFSPAALEAWHARLLALKDPQALAATVSEETIRLLVDQKAHLPQPDLLTREATLRRRIAALVEVMASLNLRGCPTFLRSALDQALPLAYLPSSENIPLASSENIPLASSEVIPLASSEVIPLASSEVIHKEQPGWQKSLDPGLEIQARFPQFYGVEAAFERFLMPNAPLHSESTHQLSRADFEKQSPPPQTQSRTVSRRSARAAESERLVMPNPALHSESTHKLSSVEFNLEKTKSVSLRRARAADVRHVSSVLPFLLLGPLSRLEYCETLAATFEAANATNLLPLFATALAYKVLAPPARGWRRDAAAVKAASAFAALDSPVDEPDLVQMVRCLSDQMSPLDSLLSGALVAGHDRKKPLVVWRPQTDADRGYLLLDSEGIFPIKWAREPEGLMRTLIQLESSPVLVPQDAAETKLLNWLTDHGFRFITSARPTRNDSWRSLRKPPDGQWWTNDMMSPDSSLVQMARVMQLAAEDAESFWQSFVIDRPSIPLSEDAEFERHLTFVAAIALGTVAWELWREREPTAPHLALERFRDLDAQVRFTRESVHVSLPLGRRFTDLMNHQLLDEVSDVPWFSGRTLTFGSG